MKKISMSIVCLLILFAFQSCSLFGPEKGYVYDKDYDPAYTSWVPGWYEDVCEEYYTTASGSRKCADWTEIYHHGYPVYHPAEYYLYISTCRDIRTTSDAHHCDNGMLSVTRYDYEKYQYDDYVDFSND